MTIDLEWIKVAKQAALEAGHFLREGANRQGTILSAKKKDIKLAEDLKAEEVILKALNSTGIPILSEESPEEFSSQQEGFYWVVDPLDGSFNYSRGIPLACTAIALCDGKAPVLGIINDFLNERLYVGGPAISSTCNELPILVSSVSVVGQAGLATGLPVARSYEPESFGTLITHARDFKKVRMLGSAVTSLVQVARGALEAYHEEDIFFWDIAAGVALIEGAGGKVELSNSKGGYKLTVFATNGSLDYSS